ncbi:hypothetical protein ACJX0J_029284, partial [Zea mays]
MYGLYLHGHIFLSTFFSFLYRKVADYLSSLEADLSMLIEIMHVEQIPVNFTGPLNKGMFTIDASCLGVHLPEYILCATTHAACPPVPSLYIDVPIFSMVL